MNGGRATTEKKSCHIILEFRLGTKGRSIIKFTERVHQYITIFGGTFLSPLDHDQTVEFCRLALAMVKITLAERQSELFGLSKTLFEASLEALLMMDGCLTMTTIPARMTSVTC